MVLSLHSRNGFFISIQEPASLLSQDTDFRPGQCFFYLALHPYSRQRSGAIDCTMQPQGVGLEEATKMWVAHDRRDTEDAVIHIHTNGYTCTQLKTQGDKLDVHNG